MKLGCGLGPWGADVLRSVKERQCRSQLGPSINDVVSEEREDAAPRDDVMVISHRYRHQPTVIMPSTARKYAAPMAIARYAVLRNTSQRFRHFELDFRLPTFALKIASCLKRIVSHGHWTTRSVAWELIPLRYFEPARVVKPN